MKDMIEHGIASKASLTALFCAGTATILYGSIVETPFKDSTSTNLLIIGIILLAATLGIAVWRLLGYLEKQEKPGPEINYEPFRGSIAQLLSEDKAKQAAQTLNQYGPEKIARIIMPMPGQDIASLLKHFNDQGPIIRYLLNDCGNAGLNTLLKVLRSYTITNNPNTQEEKEINQAYISLRHQLWEKVRQEAGDPYCSAAILTIAQKFINLLKEKECKNQRQITLTEARNYSPALISCGISYNTNYSPPN